MHGTKIEAIACVMQVAWHLSIPGLSVSDVIVMTKGSYRPQHPPQKQQHVRQHAASAEAIADAFHVHQQSMSSSDRLAGVCVAI